ncbi:NACHT, LRR and PYD domains-containing protein 12-like [Pygocentrus nattereri]|uniref:NACHT domain-containing protein n=1 Tax=Pygocentrus nattereri TaxID=42514 RepID=A0A3B4D526_PYGNA|nr:NACHT, LRR and PYD domains-containing protein 12-like [Pygocentrus nattereri]
MEPPEREMGDENTSEANVSLGYEDEDGNTPTKHDTLQRVDRGDVVTQDERACSPEPSCISMKSDWSMDPPITLQDGGVTPKQRENKIGSDAPVPSCVSLKSDHSMDPPITIKDRVSRSEQRVRQGRISSSVPSCASMITDQSMDPPNTFKEGGASAEQSVRQRRASSPTSSHLSLKCDRSRDATSSFRADFLADQRDQLARSGTQSDLSQQTYLSATLRLFEERFIGFVKEEIQKISRILRPDYTGGVEVSEEDEDGRDAREASLKIAVHILKGMKELDLVEKLVKLERVCSQQKNLKHNLKSKTQRIFEGIAKHGNPAHLDKIYTELYITEGGSGTLNSDHEVRQMEVSYRGSVAEETQINLEDIFKPLPGQEKTIRTVLTRGIAGIGKTVSVQKFILDWAEGRANQDIHFMFPLPFRELNLMSEKQFSLEGLLHCFFKEMKDLGLSVLEEYKVVFVFDGLDECRLPLNFKSNEMCADLTKPTSLDVLLTNLIMGNLLPSALLWITSRPAAANQLPARCVDQVTEVRGFNDREKEVYFYKKISEESVASRIVQHVRSSRSLHIMCHIPVFCWISATVLERLLREAKSRRVPKSLTEMYTHFLIFQTVQRNEKYSEGHDMDPCLTKENIHSLGKLAFQQLCKGNLIFYENDLRECGIDVKDASVYSGVCTQIFREELYQSKVYCFVHLSFQEYLAALFVYLSWVSFKNQSQEPEANFQELCLSSTLFDLQKSAVDLALRSKNGHLDLFLQFLLGLSLESNQILLRNLLTQEVSAEESHQETVQYIKLKLGENLRPEKSINLFHCLHELNDDSLVKEIQSYLSSRNLSSENLSPAQWSALVFVLLTSDDRIEVFDLSKYVQSDEGFKRLKLVAKASRTVKLSSCKLTKAICHSLGAVLASNSCATRILDISYNDLQDTGVKQLCIGLRNPLCLLETLNLQFCGIRRDGCSALVSALESNPSHLRELDLSYNPTGNDALTALLAFLPDCRLETLRISGCRVTKEGCVFLESAINAKPCHLRNLDLSDNSIGDLGAGVFSALLTNENCKIEYLRLEKCNITWKSCKILEGASTSVSCCLKELDLSDNDLQDTGVKQLAYDLKKCKLQKLKLSNCRFTEKGFLALASALKSNPTCLKELDVSMNFPGSKGMRELLSALQQHSCALQTLCVDTCSLDSEICASFSTTLTQNSSLRELSLSNNNIGDEGVRSLLIGLQSGLSPLKILRLSDCSLTESSCEILASTLSSNTTGLIELDLRRNSLGQNGTVFLCSISTINLRL